jgi:branched-chain amino acid transport system substrate-binding protein
MDRSDEAQEDMLSTGSEEPKGLSRREFLKIAGAAGVVVGLGTGLGGALAACGGTNTATTIATTATSAPGITTTTAPQTTTTAAVATTSVSAAAESGRPIKLGYVVPITGPLAPFASGAQWAKKHFEDAVADGMVLADKKKHPFQVVLKDTQSDANRAGQTTGDLVNSDKVDIVLAAGTPETVNPALAICEGFGCPMVSDWAEWHSFVSQAPADGFKWGYTFAFDDVGTCLNFCEVLKQAQTNNVLGLVLANDIDGITASKWAPEVFTGNGYKVVSTDLYTPGAEDFTQQLSTMKKAGCEVLVAVMLTPDFTTMWTQAHQQAFKPRVAFGHKGLIFPESVVALGEMGYNLCCAGTWTPHAHFVDSLTGMNCQEIADEYEAFSGQQWSEALIISALFEWTVDVFKRVSDIESKQAIVDTIKTTNFNSILGSIDFTAPVKDNTRHPHPNCCVPVQAAGQWIKATSGKWKVDKQILFTTDPTAVEVNGTLQPLVY